MSVPVPDPSPVVRVDDVAITHEGSAHALPGGVSFEVLPGEVVLMLGPSGSGKSTLTRALNGLIPHAMPATMTGRVHVSGLDTADTAVAELSTHVAMVFQDPDSQLVTGTVLDEVAFGLENLLVPVDEVLRRTEGSLRRMGLWHRRSENPDRLSGGGRQRLALACALAMNPEVLVLDEPTANLDPTGIAEVYATLAAVIADSDRAIVLVEHNLDAAIRFATRVIVLDQQGRLAFDGPVETVLRRHAEELAALGVWLPHATLVSLRLAAAGHSIEPLPLAPEELRPHLLDPAHLPQRPEAASAPARAPSEPEYAPECPEADAWAGTPSDAATAATVNLEAPEIPGNPAAADTIIRTRGLHISKHRVPILHGIDLELPAGSFTAMVGANGAGKTTLAQAIAGVLTPPRGQVSVAGLDPATSTARDITAQIGFVFQNPEHQFISHTVFAELAHGLRLRKLPEPEVRTRVETMLDRLGLRTQAQTHPFHLSGGQKRRLSVGTALITEPPVLILDEPTFGQDRARADELLSLLSGINDSGTTIMIVTHDLELVAGYASHTIVLAEGRLVTAGPTEQVFASDVLERAGLPLPPLQRMLRTLPTEARARALPFTRARRQHAHALSRVPS